MGAARAQHYMMRSSGVSNFDCLGITTPYFRSLQLSSCFRTYGPFYSCPTSPAVDALSISHVKSVEVLAIECSSVGTAMKWTGRQVSGLGKQGKYQKVSVRLNY
jgi:hypothetical protein